MQLQQEARSEFGVCQDQRMILNHSHYWLFCLYSQDTSPDVLIFSCFCLFPSVPEVFTFAMIRIPGVVSCDPFLLNEYSLQYAWVIFKGDDLPQLTHGNPLQLTIGMIHLKFSLSATTAFTFFLKSPSHHHLHPPSPWCHQNFPVTGAVSIQNRATNGIWTCDVSSSGQVECTPPENYTLEPENHSFQKTKNT